MRIGVDLGGTKIEAIALAATGDIVARRRVPTPAGDYDAVLAAIVDLVARVEREAGPAASVGIGTPGAISPATGLLKNSNSVVLNDRPLDVDLEAALGRPIRMANDADCLALSEASDGAGAGAASVFAVILGTGVGGGLVVRGDLVTGPNAVAGEWGHNPLPYPGPEEMPGPDCYCGRRGCVETWLSGPGLAADYPGTAEPAAIVAGAERGEEAAGRALGRYVDRLARSLAVVINIVDPHVIVLGGGMSNTAVLYDEVPARWGRYVFSDRVDTRLQPAAHGDSSGVRGAAWLWPE